MRDHGHDLAISGRRQAKAAVIRMDDRAKQTELCHVIYEFGWPFVVMLQLHRYGGDFLLNPLLNGVQHLALICFADMSEISVCHVGFS